MRWLVGIIDAMDMNLGKLLEMVRDRDTWHAAVHGAAKSQTRLSDWTDWNYAWLFWDPMDHSPPGSSVHGILQARILVRFTSVTQSCLTLSDSMDYSTPGFPVHHQLLELAQTHVHWVSDAIQSSHPLLSPSPPAFNLSQHQGLFKWLSSLHQVAKVLEFQLQHQSFPWTFRTYFL